MRSKGKHLYTCSVTNANNGMVEVCGFRYSFSELGDWNCPKCGQRLSLSGTSGKSVTEILQEGLEMERNEKKSLT
jgi:transcription initiation factor IIE alpha subunit